MFATTLLFSKVVLYYYVDSIPAHDIATIIQAAKLINAWKLGPSSYPLTRAMPKGYKPQLIFLRRNTPLNNKTIYEPIPKDERN